MAPRPRFLSNMGRGPSGGGSSKNRVQPTAYPRVPFHAVRSAQMVSAAVVVAVMAYFIGQLAWDGFGVPWTFMVLTCVSILTLLSLSLTILAHCFFGLNPKLNLTLNFLLTLLWSLGFGLLAWWSSGTLGHVCSIERWGSDDGVMVCRVYKALFAFSLFGLLATLGALLLDLHVYKRATQRGSYNAMLDYEIKRNNGGDDALPIHELDSSLSHARAGSNPFDANMESHFDDSDDDEGDRRFGARRAGRHNPEAGRMLEDYATQGYDTGYHGVHGDMGRH